MILQKSFQCAQESFLIINVKTVVLLSFFVENQFFWVSKNSIYLKYIFCIKLIIIIITTIYLFIYLLY